MFLYSKKAFFLNSPAKILTSLRLDWSWGVIRSLTKKSKFLKTNFRTVFVVSQTHGKKLKSKFLQIVDYGLRLDWLILFAPEQTQLIWESLTFRH